MVKMFANITELKNPTRIMLYMAKEPDESELVSTSATAAREHKVSRALGCIL